MRFLAIGECMAELAPADRVGEFKLGYAGDTFNTAWYLARLRGDMKVSLLSAVGRDAISDQMLEYMTDGGIDINYVQRREDRTIGLYMISLKEGERSFAYWRGQSAARTLADDTQALERSFADNDILYFSGITLAILSPDARDQFLDALGTARKAGKTVAFDPNLRPKLWPDIKSMTEAVTRASSVSDLVLPSYEDESEYFGDASPEATIERYLKVGAEKIIVKNGPEPIYIFEDEKTELLEIQALPKVVDTTAAGDSFNAGYFACLGTGKSTAEAARFASSLAGRVVQYKGALVAQATDDLA